MSARTDSSRSFTFPHGFLDFLRISQERRHAIGGHELELARLEHFNRTLRALSPQAPGMTLEQIASAGERALQRHADGSLPPFVSSRLAAFDRLQAMVADDGWDASGELRRQVALLKAYHASTDDLIPDYLPVVGLLDDAVLVDVALQLLRDELADYEDYCRFRRVAAEFAGMTEAQTGITRSQWLEAMLQARGHAGDTERRGHYVADPRASLFHVL